MRLRRGRSAADTIEDEDTEEAGEPEAAHSLMAGVAGNGRVESDESEVIVAARQVDRAAQVRQAALTGGVGLALIIFTQFILNPSGSGRGTPMAIVFQGFVGGLLVSLTTVGLILMYRSFRFLNFAGAALGVPGSILAVGMVALLPDFPFLLTLLIALALGAITGALIDLAFGRRFAKAPRLVLTVASIIGAQLIIQYSFQFILDAPWFPEGDEYDPSTDFAPARINRLLPFPGFNFNVGDFPIEFHFAHVFAIQLALLALILTGLLVRYTRLGTAVRAAAENSERAALLGISTHSIGTMIWALVGVLATLNNVLSGFAGDPIGIGSNGTAALLPPIAAAVLARFRSMPIGVFASVAIGILATSVGFTARENAGVIVSLVLFAVVIVGLVVQRKSLFREETQSASSWQASEEPRPIPKELSQVAGIRVVRVLGVVLVLAVALAFPFLTPVRYQVLGGDIFIYAIAALSLVVLTGWAGQVSLGQWAFVGIGALLTGHLATEGPGMWFAIPVATVMTGLFALVLGIPALRVRGLFLAGATFAFAVFVESFMVNPKYGRKWLETNLTRPKLVFIDFSDERSMYFLCLVGLVLTVVIVTNLRRSRFGRLLIGLRENESNVQSFGVRVVRMKLYAFALAGGIAGFAGALLEVKTRGADGLLFGSDVSIQLFTIAIIGGIAGPAGALLGAGYQNILQYFFPGNQIVGFLAPLVPLLIIYARPGGFLSMLLNLRDAVLRIVAQRQQIVVPSLFADYDAEALERRLIPIGEPSMTDGLALLPHDHRYTINSDLYGLPTRPQAELGESGESEELLAITAASEVDVPPAPPVRPNGETEHEPALTSAGADER